MSLKTLGLALLVAALASLLQAQEAGPWGLRLDFMTGFQDPVGHAGYFQASRVLWDRREMLSDELELDWGAEALWWVQGPQGPPVSRLNLPWPEGGPAPRIDPEWNNFNQSDGVNFEVLRLTRLHLKWAFDDFQAVGGLFAPDWGQGRFFRPTDYFGPLAPLTLWPEEPLGSEGLDASQALLDDLSVEAAARLTAGHGAEWVLRLPNRGIGFLVAPSFAHLSGREGLGLEGLVTFPDFQLRLEAVRWAWGGRLTALETLAGFSTRWEGGDWCLEWLKDGTGEALASFSTRAPAADYLTLFWRRALDENWVWEPTLVKSLQGGPLLFWPKLTWSFESGWTFGAEGQVGAFFSEGPLAAHPDRFFLRVDREF
ncbi:MAG TPA: hypothetical protein VMU88_04015 [bacterium]|nr:hypothetical protein [bacterium]